MQPNFPVLRDLLREDVADDIVSGLRQVIGDIRTGWNSSFKSVERVHRTNLKKLAPEQKAALRTTVDKSIEAKIENPKALVNISNITSQINSADEAAVVLSALKAITVGIRDINRNFINNCRDILSPQEAADFIEHTDGFIELPMGPKTLQFIRDHRQKFEAMLDLNDDLVVDVQKASTLLRSAINQTPVDGPPGKTRKDAALGVHFFLHQTMVATHEMFNKLVEAFKSKNLVDAEGNKSKTAPAKPGTPQPPITK